MLLIVRPAFDLQNHRVGLQCHEAMPHAGFNIDQAQPPCTEHMLQLHTTFIVEDQKAEAAPQDLNRLGRVR